jgi:diguanylate cyclase (GGDEF)-like protein
MSRVVTGLLIRAHGARAPLAPFALLALCAAAAVAHAQGNPAQSNSPHGSPAQVNPAQALVDRGALDMRADPEVSRRDAEAALRLLQQRPDADLEIRARLLLCDYYSERDEAAAQEQIAQASALLPRARRAGLRAGVLSCQGAVRETAGDYRQARALYEQALQVATAARDDEMQAEALFQRGYILGLQGEYATGLADLRRARTLFEAIKMPRHAVTVLNAIAVQYNRMGDYVQAIHIYADALEAQRGAGMQREVAVTLHNLGRAHENLREWAQARQAYSESLEASRQIGYARGEAYALRGLAAIDTASGDAAGALTMLDKAQALQSALPEVRLRGLIALARGSALHRLGRLSESLAALNEALGVFRPSGALVDLGDVYQELAEVYAQIGDWQGAYAREADYAQVSRQVLQGQLDQRFAVLKVEFDTVTKEQENAVLTRENEASRKALEQARHVRALQAAVIALTVLLASVLAWLALHHRRRSVRMRVLAMTDELTGVPNRRAVLGRLGSLLKDASATPCGVLIMDIDHFKAINDQRGHSVGDEVLKVVADQVRAAVREPAFFGRLGGEEFLIALPDVTLEAAQEVAEHFREQVMAVDTTRWFPDRRTITASIGVTVSMPTIDTTGSTLKRADTALYAAKRSGRNCVRTEASAASGIESRVRHHEAAPTSA